MKALLVMGLLAISTTAFSSVMRSYDLEHSCTLYRAFDNSNKSVVEKANAGETVFINKKVYGLGLKNLEVNFDAREAKVEIEVFVILGFNVNLFENRQDKRVILAEENPNFTTIVNHLNRKISMLEKVCISSENKIIYAENFPSN